MTLGAGNTATFTAIFAPTSVGSASGTASFTSSQLSSAFTLQMTGVGMAVAPSINTEPISQSILVGQTATFSVTASGTAPLSYQWIKNGTAISGATLSSYTTPTETTADNGAQFTVLVSDVAGKITSNVATLTVTTSTVAPFITVQPANQATFAGQTATFSVVANGTAPLSYQWRKNGTAISGAISSSYTTPAETTSDNGALFSVVVSNSAGNVISNNVTLTVSPDPVAPTITSQPASQTITAGQTATFSAGASGTAPLSYQWSKNGTAISGATSSSYTTPAETTSDNGAQFAVVVSNSAGSATSNTAVLTVNPATVAPSITGQPTSQSITAGQTATFSVVANGTAPLSYQWRKNGTAISGATSSSYTTPAETTSDNGALFSVVVSNSAGNVTSNSATLTVNANPVAPTITSQPASQTITAGQTATFSVVANGTAPLSYQWSKNGTAIGGATSSSYTTPAETTSDSGAQFTVVVSNSVGNVTSNSATLTVNPVAPTITSQPAGQTITAGQTATFSVSASGTAPLSYQWSKNGTAIGGATSSSYTTPAETTSDSGALFSVVVSNSAGNVTSNNATLTVNPSPVAPTITSQPASQTITAGQTAKFSVVANGTAPLSYQWSKNGTAISGATSSSYTTPAETTSDNGAQFTVVVSNSAGSATSNAAILTVNGTPTITNLSPTSGPVGTAVTITGTNFGSTQGTSTVKFNGTTATATSWGPISIVAPVPSGATSGNVVVTVAGIASNGVSFTIPDTTPPSIPTGLTATALSSSQISVTWIASTDNVGVTGYKIFRNGTQVGTSPTPTYVDGGLAASTSYSYTVSAYDAAGNNSAQSSPATGTTLTSGSGGSSACGGTNQLPCALGWYDIPNTTLKPALCPTYSDIANLDCANVMTAWGGGVGDPLRNQMIIWGGGHVDYHGNEIFTINLGANPQTDSLARDASHGSNLACCSGNIETNPDGSPTSRHTYDGEVYVADQDAFIMIGGSEMYNGGFSGNIWKLTPNSWSWTNQGALLPCSSTGNCGGPMGAYDPVNKLVYIYDNDQPGFYSYALATNNLTVLSTSYSGTVCNSNYYWTADIDPIRRIMICVGGNGGWKISLNAPYAVTQLNMTSCGTLNSTNAPGWAYYPGRGDFVGWAGGNTVYFYNPDTDSCTSVSYSGGPGAQQNEGTYGRMRYFPQLGVFVIGNSMTQDFFALRLDTYADANFGYRENQPGVLDSQGFDSPAIFATAVDQNNLNDGFTIASEPNISRDTTNYLSGGSSANFFIPPSAGENDTGNFWMYFGQNSTNQAFGQNSTFYVQYAFRADATWTGTDWTQYGPSGNNTAPKLAIFHNNVAGSCAQEEITTHNHDSKNLPTIYSDCGAASAVTSTDGVTYNEGGTLEYFQQGWTVASPFTGYQCEYNSGNFSGPNCFHFTANQWYTLYYKITVGTWGSANSTIEAWVAPYGQQMAKWINVHNYVLNQDTGGSCPSGGCPGWNTLELTQFMTGKGQGTNNNSPGAHVWYDEVIVSKKPIPSSCLLGCSQP